MFLFVHIEFIILFKITKKRVLLKKSYPCFFNITSSDYTRRNIKKKLGILNFLYDWILILIYRILNYLNSIGK